MAAPPHGGDGDDDGAGAAATAAATRMEILFHEGLSLEEVIVDQIQNMRQSGELDEFNKACSEDVEAEIKAMREGLWNITDMCGSTFRKFVVVAIDLGQKLEDNPNNISENAELAYAVLRRFYVFETFCIMNDSFGGVKIRDMLHSLLEVPTFPPLQGDETPDEIQIRKEFEEDKHVRNSFLSRIIKEFEGTGRGNVQKHPPIKALFYVAFAKFYLKHHRLHNRYKKLIAQKITTATEKRHSV